MSLPLEVSDITSDWLTQALQIQFPELVVEKIETTEIIWGTATKVKIDVRYRDSNSSNMPPAQLCVKGGFSEETRGIVGDAFIMEANFFANIAPSLDIRLPRCWYAGTSRKDAQGVIILDDLSVVGAQFGDPLAPWEPDLVSGGLEQLAKLHGPTWGASAEQYPGLPQGSWVRAPAEVLFSEENWDRLFSDSDRVAGIPESLMDRRIVAAATRRMWQLDDEHGVPCLSHCDPHIGNTYVENGLPGFLDWQSTSLCPGIDDVGYFLVGALSVADRRSNERELLTHYVDCLASAGGPKLTLDMIWTDYCRHHMHGYMWAATPPELQHQERAKAMIERYVAAIDDHETLKLLRD